MATRRATVILAFSAALALAAQPALAQHGGHGGGGGHSGGGGAGRAVPRGGGGYHGGGGGYHGGGAQARHPQAGTGSYYHGYHGGYYGGHYGHYPYYGHGHYPYYGYGYYPYYGSSFYFGLSFGSPYYYSGWWPYAGYGYSPGYAPYGSYGYDAPEGPPPGGGQGEAPYRSDRTCSALRGNGGESGRVRLEVRPEDASVYVDDEFCGNAREARFLTLPPGRHSIELVRPEFEVARREADVVTGQTADVLVELQQRSY
jgi:PEGA domain-containing protein